MALSKTKKDELRKRRKQVSELYLRGLTQSEIGNVLGISQGTVSIDMRWMRKKWLAKTINNYQARQAEELAKLDNLERECWKRFQESVGAQQTEEIRRLISQGEGREAVMTTVERKVKTMFPAGQYIDKILVIIEKRCKLLGLNEPDRLEIGGDLADALRDLAEREKEYSESQEKGEKGK